MQNINDWGFRVWKHKCIKLINHRQDTDKIYLYVKDPYEIIHQLLINKTRNYKLKTFG